jgi:pimeloyl-ACP methyl ester carboxylesterase
MASRRDALKIAAAAGVAASQNLQTASAQTAGSTFVLVHGAWSGGYIWRRVADRLRKNGHTVFTPTNTGLADRAHLLSKNITIDTFVKDVTGVFEAEELSNDILVGHSFGGNTITGVADVIPEKNPASCLSGLLVTATRQERSGRPAARSRSGAPQDFTGDKRRTEPARRTCGSPPHKHGIVRRRRPCMARSSGHAASDGHVRNACDPEKSYRK